MRTLDRNLHGDLIKRPLTRVQRAVPKRGYTVKGSPRKRPLYNHPVGGAARSELSIIPRGHPDRIAQAKRLRRIRNFVIEMMGPRRQWPSIKGEYKPRKAS